MKHHPPPRPRCGLINSPKCDIDAETGQWALVKNPEDLTGDQRTTLAGIATTNKGLYRAYLLN